MGALEAAIGVGQERMAMVMHGAKQSTNDST
jgi:hypothetical protein